MTLPGGINGDVMTHSWKYMGHTSQNPMGIEAFGLVMGLGFVMSFGYWCTDFLVIQRAMSANSMSASRRTPVIAALPKMMMPFIVIVPGIAALALSQMAVGYDLPMKNGGPDYDQVLTTLMAQVLPGRNAGRRADRPDGVVHERHGGQRHRVQHGLHLRHLPDAHQPGQTGSPLPHGGPHDDGGGRGALDRHGLPGAAYNSINDLLQLVFSFVNAPLFATFLLGMFWKRTSGHGAFFGLLSGTVAAALTHGFTMAEGKGGWITTLNTFPSSMAQNFWIAIMAWTTCFFVTIRSAW